MANWQLLFPEILEKTFDLLALYLFDLYYRIKIVVKYIVFVQLPKNLCKICKNRYLLDPAYNGCSCLKFEYLIMKSLEQMDHSKLQGIRSNPAAVALKIVSRGQNRADGITDLSLVNLEF